MDDLERTRRVTPPMLTLQRAPAATSEDLVPEDVTDAFGGLAPEDKVYRTADGYHVKVKCIRGGGIHGAETIHITGAIVGRDGKALRREDDSFCIHQEGRGHTHKADGRHAPDLALEFSRLLVVQETVNAEIHYQQLKAAPHVVTREAHHARKASEVGAPDAAASGEA